MRHALIETPIASFLALRDAEALRGLWFDRVEPPDDSVEDAAAFADLRAQFDEYFAGTRRRFDLVLAPQGTEFQRRVWEELTRIDYGTTISYAELACRVGDPKAVRAVGTANGANPIPVIIPCHRVIGSNGSLTGFGGGLERKRALLQLEGVRVEEGRQGDLFA